MTPIADIPKFIDPQPSLSEQSVVLAPAWAQSSLATTCLTASRTVSMTVSPRVASSEWFDPVISQFRSLLQLERGWNTYDAQPASYSAIQNALAFMTNVLNTGSKPPSVVALEDGGLQLVWHDNGLDVEATFPVGDEPEVYVHDLESGEAVEVNPSQRETRQQLQDLLQRLRD